MYSGSPSGAMHSLPSCIEASDLDLIRRLGQLRSDPDGKAHREYRWAQDSSDQWISLRLGPSATRPDPDPRAQMTPRAPSARETPRPRGQVFLSFEERNTVDEEGGQHGRIHQRPLPGHDAGTMNGDGNAVRSRPQERPDIMPIEEAVLGPARRGAGLDESSVDEQFAAELGTDQDLGGIGNRAELEARLKSRNSLVDLGPAPPHMHRARSSTRESGRGSVGFIFAGECFRPPDRPGPSALPE
jgi:hypothetical protein